MRFNDLELLYVNVFQESIKEVSIDVLYKPLDMETDDIDNKDCIRVVVQNESVNIWLENEELKTEEFLTNEEELFVLQTYAKDTIYEVAK